MTSNMTNNNPFTLVNRNFIITGSGHGLGKAMSLGLAAAGANVVIAGRTASPTGSNQR